MTSLNSNATEGDCYIATLTLYDGVAIFEEGATKPTALDEPDLQDIPAKGIPSADYNIETTTDDITGVHSWDTQDEVSNKTVTNEDLATIIGAYVLKSLFSAANYVLYSSGASTPAGLEVAVSRILGRKATGDFGALTAAEIKTILSLSNVTDVTQMPLSYLDTDEDLTADSDTKVPTQRAVKGYVEGKMTSVAATTCLVGTPANMNSQSQEFYVPFTTISAVGRYVFQYFFLHPSTTLEDPVDWDSPQETIEEIANTNSTLYGILPEEGDAKYGTTGALDGKIRIVYRARFEGLFDNTSWTATGNLLLNEPNEVTLAQIVAELEASSTLIDAVSSNLSVNPTFTNTEQS